MTDRVRLQGEDRRLIEDYLPLEVLSEIASREKLNSRRYVELVHYWPARRPITAMRAAIYAALAPAPRNGAERKEAAAFVGQLAAYRPEPETISKAAVRIRELHGGRAPKVLDPFAGGGGGALEAARLGCESHAIDYNPVAHLIELCTLVYPQRYGSGLADDFERWSAVLLQRMRREVGDLYPAVSIPEADPAVAAQTPLFADDGADLDTRTEPLAYVWARTVPCRRPGCGAPVPLVRQAWLRKKGRAVAAVPRIDGRNRLRWDIVSGPSAGEVAAQTEQTGSGQAVCVACNTPAPAVHVKEMATAGRMGESLAAVVGTAVKIPGGGGVRKRYPKLYLRPDETSVPSAAGIEERIEILVNETGLAHLNERMNTADSTTVAGRGYGISQWRELFTSRQLLVLFTFIKHIRHAHGEMRATGMDAERARALVTWFGMAFGRLVIAFNKFARWRSDRQVTEGIFDRQALKMTYDYSELNGLGNTQGCLPFAIERITYAIRELATTGHPSVVTRGNAEKLFYADETFDAVITDPPYYSSIYYADLSAFFYVWLKRILGDLYPEHFTLAAPPKRREAVAQPSQHGGDAAKADAHYQELMRRSFAEARRVLKPGAPLVCVYAHRTTAGWATLIRALIGAGLTVTEAWPVQTESRGRVNAHGAAALSDSIFFVARRREEAATGRYETEVAPELDRIARERVRTLWAGGSGIGGADLLMAAVGAGLRAYTRFAAVEYANGEPVPAERFLREVEGAVLEVILEEIFGLPQAAVGSVDALTRFYVLWRFSYREWSIDAGEAYVFCQAQGIELGGAGGTVGAPPAPVEKAGTRFRVRTYQERGGHAAVGRAEHGRPAPLVDVLHRVLWLLDNRPADLQDFLAAARPNQEQLRLVTEALSGPVHGRSELRETGAGAPASAEQRACARLTANWRSVIEHAALADRTDRVTGQQKLALEPLEYEP